MTVVTYYSSKSNTINSQAAEMNIALTKYQCFNLKKCYGGKTPVWKDNKCVCKKAVCKPGSQQCNGNKTKLMECSADGSGWKVSEDCAHGCNSGGCIPDPKEKREPTKVEPTLKKCGGYGQRICPQ